MVSKTLAFRGNGLFCGRDDHIEIEIQLVLNIGMLGVSFKRCGKKISNRSRDPVDKPVLAGKGKVMSRVKVKMKEFLACKFDSGQYLPHVGDMENIKELLRMLSTVWCP